MNAVSHVTRTPSLSVQRSGGRILPRHNFERAAYAAVVKASSGVYGSEEATAKHLWPSDSVTPILLQRAAVTPVATGDAAALAATAVADFYGSLGATPSAASRLINAGLRLTLDRWSTITIPKRVGLPSASMAFVGEGDAAPARQFTLDGAEVGPAKKLVSIVIMTRELTRRTSAEDMLVTLLREDAAVSLDAAIFSTAAASDDRPAGLLHAISGLTATAGGGDAARHADLEKLATAVAAGGGSGNVVFIANPRQAASIRVRQPDFALDVWPSLAVAAGTVIAVDPSVFVSAFGPEADIQASTEALIHAEDTAPQQIGTPGETPGDPTVVASPVRSLFQTDCIALKTTVSAAWALRAPAVSFVSSATWG